MRGKFQFQLRTLLVATTMVGVFFAGRASMNSRIHSLERKIQSVEANNKIKSSIRQLLNIRSDNLKELTADLENQQKQWQDELQELRELRKAKKESEKQEWEFKHSMRNDQLVVE